MAELELEGITWIRQRAQQLAGIKLPAEPRVLRDTSNFIAIDRGDVLDLDDELYLVCGNDHIILDDETKRARWIDFDFDRPSLTFDVLSLGNVLNCVAAKGFVTFHTLQRTQPELLARINDGDGSMFFLHRVMNVHRIYPSVPPRLAAMLERFSVAGRARYQSAQQVADDLEACIEETAAPNGRHH
jgi:hypothetical protein